MKKSKIQNPKSEINTVWVLSGAPTFEPPTALQWIARPDIVVAADGGSALAAMLGVQPDLVVGDLDSIDPALLAEFRTAGVAMEQYEHNTKWETDTELAALAALRWQPETIVIVGAIGGRLDHALANVLLLTHPSFAGIDLRIVETNHEATLAKPGRWNELHGNAGDLLSLLPVGQVAEGVKTEGLLYPLHSEALPYGKGRGVSNEFTEGKARVWLDSGLLLVVVAHRN